MRVYVSKNLGIFSVIPQLQTLMTNLWLIFQDILHSWWTTGIAFELCAQDSRVLTESHKTTLKSTSMGLQQDT